MIETALYDEVADRLLRWYPRSWRDRYGEEFAALLCDQIAEQPRSWRRDADVRWHGVKARLSAVGLGHSPLRDRNAMRTVEAVTLACFLGCLVSLWSQILRGSSSAPYAHPAVAAMRVVLAATFLVIGLWAFSGVTTLARRVMRARDDGHGSTLVPALLMVGIGSALFAAGITAVWSRLHWAVTPTSVSTVAAESISTFWLHPHLLGQVPGAQIVWMVVSPFAVAVVVAGGLRLHRILDEVAPVLGSPMRQRRWQAASLAPALVVSTWWVISSRQLQMPALRAGTLDAAMIAAMTALLAVHSTVSRTRAAESG